MNRLRLARIAIGTVSALATAAIWLATRMNLLAIRDAPLIGPTTEALAQRGFFMLQIYAAGAFYVLVVIGIAIGAYIATRWD